MMLREFVTDVREFVTHRSNHHIWWFCRGGMIQCTVKCLGLQKLPKLCFLMLCSIAKKYVRNTMQHTVDMEEALSLVEVEGDSVLVLPAASVQ